MAIYLLTPLGKNAEQVRNAVASKIPTDSFFLLPNDAGCLVNYKGTSVELSNELGITSPEANFTPSLPSTMVTSVGSYYGRGPTNMWDWLKTRIEGQR